MTWCKFVARAGSSHEVSPGSRDWASSPSLLVSKPMFDPSLPADDTKAIASEMRAHLTGLITGLRR